MSPKTGGQANERVVAVLTYVLEVLRHCLGLVVVASNGVGSCQDGRAGGEAAHNARLGDADALLLLQHNRIYGG